MVGGIVLRECLNSPKIGQVTALLRRSTGIKHEKLTEVIHSDFSDFSAIEHVFENQDIAQFCIGVYTGKVSREDFRKITVDYTQAFGDRLKKHSPQARLCFLSGAGADRTEKSRMMFAKDKGAAENYLFDLGLGEVYTFRPAYIYPVEPREEPNLMYRISRSIYPLLSKLTPKSAITSERLGKAMFKAGLEGAHKNVLENEDIKAII